MLSSDHHHKKVEERDSVSRQPTSIAITAGKMSEFNLTAVARANILELTPYRCARDDYSDGILLDANENSIGPAVATHGHLQLNRYPDPLHYNIKELFGNLRGVRKEQIFFGVGSDEAIDILFRIFCNPRQDNAIITPPTYGMYKVCAKVNDVSVKTSPLTPTFEVNMESLISTIDPNTKLIFLCSPGNPTAKVIANSVIEEILKVYTTGIVVVDEAYIDFSDEDHWDFLEQFDNVILSRTLSKSYSLAGMRVGFGISSPEIIQEMDKVRDSYNLDRLAQCLGTAALAATEDFKPIWQQIRQTRQRLTLALEKLDFKVLPSDANFVLASPQWIRAFDLYQQLKAQKVLVRYFKHPRILDYVRISIGTESETDQLLTAIAAIQQDYLNSSKG